MHLASNTQTSSRLQTAHSDFAAPAVAQAPTGGPSRPDDTHPLSDSSEVLSTADEWAPAVAVDQLAQPPSTAPIPAAAPLLFQTPFDLLSRLREVARWVGLNAVFASEILQSPESMGDQQQQHQQQLEAGAEQLLQQLPGDHRVGLIWEHGGVTNPEDEDVPPGSTTQESNAILDTFTPIRTFPDELEETQSLDSPLEDVRFWPLVAENTNAQPGQDGDIASAGDLPQTPQGLEEPTFGPLHATSASENAQQYPLQSQAGPLAAAPLQQPVVGAAAVTVLQALQAAEQSGLIHRLPSTAAATTTTTSSHAPGEFDPRLIAVRGQGRGHQQAAETSAEAAAMGIMEGVGAAEYVQPQDDSWPWASETAAIPEGQRPKDDSGSWDWTGASSA